MNYEFWLGFRYALNKIKELRNDGEFDVDDKEDFKENTNLYYYLDRLEFNRCVNDLVEIGETKLDGAIKEETQNG